MDDEAGVGDDDEEEVDPRGSSFWARMVASASSWSAATVFGHSLPSMAALGVVTLGGMFTRCVMYRACLVRATLMPRTAR